MLLTPGYHKNSELSSGTYSVFAYGNFSHGYGGLPAKPRPYSHFRNTNCRMHFLSLKLCGEGREGGGGEGVGGESWIIRGGRGTNIVPRAFTNFIGATW